MLLHQPALALTKLSMLRQVADGKYVWRSSCCDRLDQLRQAGVKLCRPWALAEQVRQVR
jgi:hypothetical protein